MSLCYVGQMEAQNQKYHVGIASKPYQSVPDGNSFYEFDWKSSEFAGERLPIGFEFPFLDSSFSTVKIEYSGRLIFDQSHCYFADPYVLVNWESASSDKDFPTDATYQNIRDSDKEKFLIQISNVRFSSNPDSMIDFQITLQSDGCITFHGSPHQANRSLFTKGLGPFIGVYHIESFEPVLFNYGQNVISSQNDSVKIFKGEAKFLTFESDFFPEGDFLITQCPISNIK